MIDALRIARWRWPDSAWDWAEYDGGSLALNSEHKFDSRHHRDVHAAELVLIERGLRREYGDALHRIVAAESGIGDFPDGDWDATMAMAPLASRVRALAAVIEAQEKGK